MLNNIFIVFFLLFSHSFAAWDESKSQYYKKKYLNKKAPKESSEPIYFVTQKIKDKFSKRYGEDALRRLNHFDQSVRGLQDASLYKKLSTINKLVNKLHFMPDGKHWKKEDYWATPLETIGTNYGDTEDIALLKYVLLVKAGINPRDIQLIKKSTPFTRKNKTYKENMSLFYFTKEDIFPLVIDYKFRSGKIYKYADQFDYTFIKISPDGKWDQILSKNVKKSDIDKMVDTIGTKKIKKGKTGIHIYY
jgi:predicted transglutaminase-like cysteine proteinase